MKFCAIDMKAWRRNISASLAVMLIAISSFAKETWHYDDLELFIKGSTIMAAGGGGSPVVANQLLRKYFSPSGSVVLNDVADLRQGQNLAAASVGAIGSPADLFSLPDPLALPSTAYSALNFVYNSDNRSPIDYLMPIEVGAINGLYSFLLAYRINSHAVPDAVSVLNVDGGGRSVPTLPLLIYSQFPNIYSQEAAVTSPTATVIPPSVTPDEWAFLTAAGGNQQRVEKTILAMLAKNSPYQGAAGYGSFWTLVDDLVTAPPVQGQLSVARNLGGVYASAPAGDKVAASLTASQRTAKHIFSGRVASITRDTAGLDYGLVTIIGTGAYQGDTFTIQYENENICAFKASHSNTEPYVLGPDSIAYVPTDGAVFDNSDLYDIVQKGQHPYVDIVAILASPRITGIPGIMDSWSEVRSAIPHDACNFPYSSPWNGGK